jgi:cobalt-zinc-cadmium efflux system protein
MGHHHHHHEHGSGKNLGITILLNIIITLAQLVGGLISGSMALISDATHNFSDVLSLIISWVAKRLARTEPSAEKTFGRRRSEILAAFFNSATLIVLSVFILYEAIERLISGPKTIEAFWVIWLAVLSIAVNGLSVLFIRGEARNNMNMRSAYLHLFSDMITSVAVLAGGLAMKYLGWFWVDPVFSIGIALYLLYLSWDIFRASIRILMQYTPQNLDLKGLLNELEQIPEIDNLHHVHIWQLNDHDIMFESHVDLKKDIPVSAFDDIRHRIEEILSKYDIHHATLQPEFEVDDDKDVIHAH